MCASVTSEVLERIHGLQVGSLPLSKTARRGSAEMTPLCTRCGVHGLCSGTRDYTDVKAEDPSTQSLSYQPCCVNILMDLMPGDVSLKMQRYLSSTPYPLIHCTNHLWCVDIPDVVPCDSRCGLVFLLTLCIDRVIPTSRVAETGVLQLVDGMDDFPVVLACKHSCYARTCRRFRFRSLAPHTIFARYAAELCSPT